MGNPHPTRSKPCKIGRKHTGAPREKEKARKRQAQKIHLRIKVARRRKRNAEIAKYFRGERPYHPEKQ